MKKFVFAAVFALAGLSSAAQAGGCDSPFCQGQGRGWFGGHGRSAMPAFQAAPWYLYWPYNQHFMTPAPMQGAYSAPPMGYGGLANPYFPGGAGVPTPMPAAPTPPAPMPQPAPAVTPQPGGVSIPAVPGIIRTSGRR